MLLNLTLTNGLMVTVWRVDEFDELYDVDVCITDNPWDEKYNMNHLPPKEVLKYLAVLQNKKL